MKKLRLKNIDYDALVDDKVYDWLQGDPKFENYDIVNNLRLHSSGCAVFQKVLKNDDGSYRTVTFYLHKLIAEKFLIDTKTEKNNLVGARNGDKLDCQLSNLEYRSRSTASRKRKTSSSTGYTGVYKEHNKYRAVISINGKAKHIGMFKTAEDAARAYNELSIKHYGDDGKVNIIPEDV